MDFRVNGVTIDMGAEDEEGLGLVLARADEFLEREGSVITGLAVDGRPIGPDDYGSIKDLRVGGVRSVDLAAESSSDYRAKALGLLVDLIAMAAEAARGEASSWEPLRAATDEFVRTLSGLFSADELSFVQSFASLVDTASGEAAAAGGRPGPETLADFEARVSGFDLVFRERLAEIKEPAAEMRRCAELFAAEAEELRELPVYLQTGKEDRAMKAVLLFIEIFNKVIRLIPELRRLGVDTSAIKVEGQELPAFYASFNEILRSLSKALEDKDSVLMGDLAEYEVAPRMGALFASIEKALPR